VKLCTLCVRSRPHANQALANVDLCEEHLREQQRDRTGGQFKANTLDDVRPFSLQAEASRIERVENALHGLDMATALRVLEYVRSRVVGNGGFR
jgi:hypothetical protein